MAYVVSVRYFSHNLRSVLYHSLGQSGHSYSKGQEWSSNNQKLNGMSYHLCLTLAKHLCLGDHFRSNEWMVYLCVFISNKSRILNHCVPFLGWWTMVSLDIYIVIYFCTEEQIWHGLISKFVVFYNFYFHICFIYTKL